MPIFTGIIQARARPFLIAHRTVASAGQSPGLSTQGRFEGAQHDEKSAAPIKKDA